MDKAKEIGMDAYRAELDEKIRILETLLEHYDDGRRKSFFCIAVNLLELEDVHVIMEQISAEALLEMPLKERAKAASRLFEEMAARRDISLKLRK